MGWTKVLASDALAVGDRQVVTVGKQNILVVNHEGQFYAVDNKCPHMKLPMKKGKITADGAITCPFHRSVFDLRTGEVRNWTPWPPVVGNVLGKISSEKPLSVFPVRVEEGSIWVEVEE